MKTGLWTAFALCLLLPKAALATTVIGGTSGNGSFEIPIGGSTYGNWDNTNGAVRLDSASVTGLGFTAPPDGGFALQVPAGAFTFQLSDAVKEGDFVSFSVQAVSNIAAANGGHFKIEFKQIRADGSDFTFQTIDSVRINSGNAPAAGSYVRFTISGVAPKGTQRVAFTMDANGTGSTIFDNIFAAINPAELTLSLSKNHAVPGGVVAALATFVNQTGDTLSNVSYAINVSSGLDVPQSGLTLNGVNTSLSSGGFVNVGTVAAAQTVRLSAQILVTHGAQPGKEYDIEVKIFNGQNLSETRRARIIVENDPVFDEGTIIGKVFNDTNKNGVQDKGEKGVPFVRLATEDGIVIVTDEHGRYSIPAVKPGRHVVKIDGHTLPEGTKFITEEAYLVKITPGLLAKANFAVLMPPSKIPEEFQEDLMVRVTQGLDTSTSRLTVSMDPDVLKTGLGILDREASFKMDCNYPDFVKRWYLEVRDEMGHEIWTGFGVGAPPSDVRWNGQMENSLLIKPGVYSYQLKVEDKGGRQDWSPLSFFHVIPKNAPPYLADAKPEIPTVGDFNLFKDGKRSIPLVAKPTIRIQGKTKPKYKVTVNQYPVKVDPQGNFQTEVYTSPGDKEVLVQATSPDGETTSYHDTIKVKDSMFFMVALSEAQGGVNFSDGNLQSAGDERQYKDKIYSDGRISYYLKGKIRGKFLVKSHYDTDDKSAALFKNLNPNDYYPIYGDGSTRDYEAQNTQSRFYMVVEMDRSFIRWGSFNTSFNDVELATYNRTLSGLKASFDTTKTTKYGDPVRGTKLFWTESGQQADHNEFASTGGTLYYLRNRRIIQGSEKLRVETRDKIQNMPVSSRDLVEGVDYEIDYNEGRVLLTKPLSMVSSSDTILSRDILDGNPVYLIADYEFDPGPDAFKNADRGIRGYTHMGDHVRAGATYVEEVRDRQRYDLRGVDLELKAGRNTRIYGEYAASSGGSQTSQSVSYNGGLSFDDPAVLTGQKTKQLEEAYVIRAESKPVKNLEVSGFIQDAEPGFSNQNIQSQSGTQKYGVSTRYKLADFAYLRYRYDYGKVVNQLLPLSNSNLFAPYDNFGTHTAQLVYDDGKYLGQLEYQNQHTGLPTSNLAPSLLSENPYDHAVGAKAGYHINDKLLAYVKAQASMNGKPNNQFGGGVRYEVMQGVYGYIEEMVGNLGDSTYMGFEKNESSGARSYATIRMPSRAIGQEPLTTAIGSSFPLTEKSRIYSERDYSSYNGQEGFANIDATGLEGRLGEAWNVGYDLRLERRRLDTATAQQDMAVQAPNSLFPNNTGNTVSAALNFSDNKKLKAGTRIEVRRDSDTTKLWQIVTRNYLEYKYTESLSFLTKLDYGKTMLSTPEDNPADFMDFSTGFAYRPLDNDKLNILGRYTFERNLSNDLQFATPLFNGVQTNDQAHIFSIDIAYDLFKYVGFVQKLAYKRDISETADAGAPLITQYTLFVERFNFHVTRKWDLGLEYRGLWQFGDNTELRQGALAEIDREFYEYVRLGAGYNFTDFSDDLRTTNNFNSHGPFVRLTGKF